jgi:DNA-binding SARP family transcriptional activator/tetratricopeptide (TPR) repeat protein
LLVADADGRFVTVRGSLLRSLLAMLLFHANEFVPVERLVGALWPDVAPKSYSSNLYTYVSRLRARIGPAVIDHASDAYRLRVDQDELDLLVFLAEADVGRRDARTGDAGLAATHFRRALVQWRGPVLADVHVPALDPDVARLENERLAVLEDCMGAELALGRHAELVGELQATLAQHPLRERLAGQLMIALQRSGRQAEALAVYREARSRLVEESGIEPGAELRTVHAAVLSGEAPAPSLVVPVWPICQLPADIADFSGRQASIDELTGALGEGALLVLSGQPGVGKSTLAIRLGHRLRADFPDGQLFAHLAGASNPRPPAEVLADWLRALGMTGSMIPDDVQARAATFRGRLTDRNVLVVLDDAADPAQVRPLLPGTPGCAVIVTSRRRLSGLAGAHRVSLNPFTDAEAGQLLRRIAGDRVASEPADAARITAACGNLPLALRIAATRLALRPQLRLATLANRLEDELKRLDELAVSDLGVRSSLALSYQGLTAPARTALQLIGLVDIANVPAWAMSVLQDGEDFDGAIEELIESSLLQPAGVDRSGEPRYRMHDMIRAFARALALANEGLADRQTAGRRLVDTALALADLAVRQLPRVVPLPDLAGDVLAPPLTPEVVDRLLADPDTLLATERPALVAGITLMSRVGVHRRAMLIFERFIRYLWLHGQFTDIHTCAASLLKAGRLASDEHVETRAEAVLALVLHAQGRHTDAEPHYRHCVERLSRLDDQPALAWTLNNLANCLIELGEPEQALHLATRSARLFTDDDFGAASALSTQAAALQRLGRAAESITLNTEALRIAQRSGQPHHIALALNGLSWSRALTDRLTEATALAEEAVALLRPSTARSALAGSLCTQGMIHAACGRRTRAVAALHEARAIASELNEHPRELSCTTAIAASWIGDGRAAEAIPQLTACLQAYDDTGGVPAATMITLRLLAIAYEAAGDRVAADLVRGQADRLEDPRDVNARTVARFLTNLALPN